jgi:hypothetical protein
MGEHEDRDPRRGFREIEQGEGQLGAAQRPVADDPSQSADRRPDTGEDRVHGRMVGG